MKSIVLILFPCMCYTGVIAQGVDRNPPELVTLTKENNIRPGEAKVIEATGRIRFTSGFVSKGFLRTVFISKQDPAGKLPLRSSYSVFPNPAYHSIQIKGSFRREQISIFDHSGNLLMEKVIAGDDPAIDISPLTEGEYLLKNQRFTIRLIKK